MINSQHKNKLIYWLMMPVFILLLIMGLLYAYINSENFLANIKSVLITQLENSLGKRVEIGTIDYISFQSLQATGIAVFEDKINEKEVLFQAEQLKAGYSLLFSLLRWKDWQLNIHDITFYGARIDTVREIDGEFDILKKFELEVPGEGQQNFFIEQIYFRESELTLHDKLVFNYNQDALTTQVVNIQGYLDLSQLPEITFDFQGRQGENNALLSLQGRLLVDRLEYSLDFHLENADIMHFQYYLEPVEQFNVDQGIFNLNLNLSFSPELDPVDLSWQGEASFQQVDAKLSFLEDIPINNISGSVHFLKPKVVVSELKGLYRDNIVSLQGFLLTEPEVSFDFDIESEGLNTSDLKEDIYSILMPAYSDFSLQGKMNLAGNIKGELENFQIAANASSAEINLENIVFKDIDSSFLFNQDGLFVHSLNIHDSDFSSIKLNGQIDWSGDIPFYQIFLETKYLSLQSSLLKQFSLPEDVSGNVSGQFKMQSAKEDSSIVNIEGQFMVNSVKTKDISLSEALQGNIKSTVRFSDKIVSVHQGEIFFMQNKAFLNGNINYNDPVNFALNFKCQLPELDELATSLGVSIKPTGRAEINGSFDGSPDNPEINAEVQLEEFSIHDYLLDEIIGKLVFQNSIITLEEFSLTSQDIKLIGNGDIALHESSLPEIDFFYQFETIAIDSLMQRLNESIPLSGQVAGSGNLQGIWPGLALQGNFQLDRMIYNEYFLNKGQVVFGLQPEQAILSERMEDDNLLKLLSWTGYFYSLELEKLELQNEEMELLIIGETKLGEDNLFSGDIAFSHQALGDIFEYFYPIDDDNLKMFLPSKISGKARLEGNRYEQQMIVSTQFMPQQTQNIPPSKIESVFTRNQQGFTISDFRFIQPEGEFRAEGKIGFDQELDIVFQAEELDINTLMSLAQIDEVMRGVINIEGLCKGTISQPDVSITTQIKEGYFREFQFKDLQSTLYWGSTSNILEINKFIITLEEDYLIEAKGNLPLDAFALRKEEISPTAPGLDIPLDFQIKMEKTDMKVLRLFWKDVFSETTGNIDLEFNLTGTVSEPLVNGMVDIHKGKVALDDLPVEIEELNSRIVVSDNKAILPSIYFIVYENRFNMSGQFELINLLPENILITIQNDEQRIIYKNIIDCEANFLAEIRGSLLEPEIKGQLILSKGQLNLDQLQALSIEGNTSESSFTAPDTLQSHLDMNIEIVDPFILRLPNAEIYVTGKIALTGSFTQPFIQGNIVLRRGYLRYFEKRFDISDGRVSINGFTAKDININARALTNVQDVQITIHISGNLTNPQIRLSSQPVMQETEIISLLALGRNIEGLSKGEIDQLLSQEMIDIVFQSLQMNIFKRIERELAEQLGLDLLRLSTENLMTSDSQFPLLERMNLADLTLEVGKNIREDLFVTYKTPLDFQGEKSISIDYKISSDFTFNTQFDTFSLRDDDYRFQFGLKINF